MHFQGDWPFLCISAYYLGIFIPIILGSLIPILTLLPTVLSDYGCKVLSPHELTVMFLIFDVGVGIQ